MCHGSMPIVNYVSDPDLVLPVNPNTTTTTPNSNNM